MAKKRRVDLTKVAFVHVQGFGNVPLEAFPAGLKIKTEVGEFAVSTLPKTMSLKASEATIGKLRGRMQKLGLKLVDTNVPYTWAGGDKAPKWSKPVDAPKRRRDERLWDIPWYRPVDDPLFPTHYVPVRVDKYRNFTELSMAETEYDIAYRLKDSNTVIFAVHGGNMEPGTTEIADAIANDVYNFYSFISCKAVDNNDLHITSSVYDEPLAREMVRGKTLVLSFHGAAGAESVAYLGGRDEARIDLICRNLVDAGFAVATNLDPGLCGRDKGNIVNSGDTGKGVQFELSRGLRDSFFADGMETRAVPTETFHKFVDAIRVSL